ncbi:MAG: protein translocase subunit SecF [Enterobacterales bacterium]
MIEKLSTLFKIDDQNINFLLYDKIILTISCIIIIISLNVIYYKNFNFGLDFSGGTKIELHCNNPINIEKLSYILKNYGFNNLFIQYFGTSKNVIIKINKIKNKLNYNLNDKITSIIYKKLHEHVLINDISYIGPNVGNEILKNGILSILISLIFIFIYVSFRFEWRMSISAIIALLHDIIITLGILSIFNIEVDMTTIAALMSVIGYSLNDSIVVFDRVRENFKKIDDNVSKTFNISLNQVFKRTIITSSISIMMVLILFIFGGNVMHNFAFVLLIGIIIGTFSSIYIASSIAIKLGIKRDYFL